MLDCFFYFFNKLELCQVSNHLVIWVNEVGVFLHLLIMILCFLLSVRDKTLALPILSWVHECALSKILIFYITLICLEPRGWDNRVISKKNPVFTPYPLFQWYPQSTDSLLNLSMKCRNSVWNPETQHLMHKFRD